MKANLIRQKLFFFVSIGVIVAIYLFLFRHHPIYPDEVTNQYLSSSSSVYQGYKVWLIESCHTLKVKVHWIIILISNLYQFPYKFIENSQDFRFFHLFLGVSLFLQIFYLLYKYSPAPVVGVLILIWPIGYINSFVIIRPEFYVLLSLCSLIFYLRSNNTIIMLVVVLVLYTLSLNAHAKAIYFAPLYALAIIRSNSFSRTSATIGLAATLYLMAVTIIYALFYSRLAISCEYEYINEILKKYQISPFLLISDPLEFLKNVIYANNIPQIDRAISQLMLRNNYDIGYLPNLVGFPYLTTIVNFIYFSLITKYLLCCLRMFQPNVLVLIYLCTSSAIFLLNANKAAYDMFFYINLFVLSPLFNFNENK